VRRGSSAQGQHAGARRELSAGRAAGPLRKGLAGGRAGGGAPLARRRAVAGDRRHDTGGGERGGGHAGRSLPRAGDRRHVRQHPVGGGGGSPKWYQLAGGGTSALDVGAPIGSDVYSPVDGTVVAIRPFVVEGKTYGSEIDVQPQNAPSVVVAVTQLASAPALAVGSAVVGGATGYLMDLGVPEHAARTYSDQIKQGGVFVSVHEPPKVDAVTIRSLFEKSNGRATGYDLSDMTASPSVTGSTHDAPDGTNSRLGANRPFVPDRSVSDLTAPPSAGVMRGSNAPTREALGDVNTIPRSAGATVDTPGSPAVITEDDEDTFV